MPHGEHATADPVQLLTALLALSGYQSALQPGEGRAGRLAEALRAGQISRDPWTASEVFRIIEPRTVKFVRTAANPSWPQAPEPGGSSRARGVL